MQYQLIAMMLFVASAFSCSYLPSKRNIARQINQVVQEPDQTRWHLQITQTDKVRNLSTGNKNTIVAIIDTGIDTHHPDLSENLWINQIEKNGKKGIDDDQNGFIDDIHGWNFANNNANVYDEHGHGTHVAGIIGGTGKICQKGISPEVSLMILKYYDAQSKGNENLNNTISAIYYAIQNGAHIINFSGGGGESSEKEREAIEVALEKNILFVTAGGNESSTLEKKPYYPASYNLPNILSVGSSGKKDSHSNFSNSGSVLTAHAPGEKLYSTLPGSRCGYLTGTSQSTPIFTGGAVLIKDYKKLTKASDIIQQLQKTTDSKRQLMGKSSSGGRANFNKALQSEHLNVSVSGVVVESPINHSVGTVLDDGERGSYYNYIEQFTAVIKDAKKRPIQKPKRDPATSVDYKTKLLKPRYWRKIFLSPSQPTNH